MMYDFQKLADVELLEEVPEGASAFVEVDGAVKRVPGSGLGGGGVATAILRYSADAEGRKAEGGIAVQISAPTYTQIPITCDNMTYAQALAVLQAGEPLAVMYGAEGQWATAIMVAITDGYICPSFLFSDSPSSLYWNADGFFMKQS